MNMDLQLEPKMVEEEQKTSDYGTDAYHDRGSHGCINIPYSHEIKKDNFNLILRVYVDEVNKKYYLDSFAYLELAFVFHVDGKPVYDLGNNSYKGNLDENALFMRGYGNLIEISEFTLEELKKELKDRIEYINLPVLDNQSEKIFNNQLNESNPFAQSNEYPNNINKPENYALDDVLNQVKL